MSGRRCFFCRCRFGSFRQTFQQCLVGDKAFHLVAVGLCYHVITELEGEQSEFLIDLFQTLFLVGRQVGSVIRKMLVGLCEKSHLLSGEP